MIKLEDIYNVTNAGKDIILFYYPQAVENKKFAIRDEKTPSATMKKIKDVWRVTDFGDDGVARSPVDVCMKEEHCTFTEAVFKLADRYGVNNSLSPAINKADIRQEDAPDDVLEGHFDYELNDEFSDAELKILGPNVTQEHCTKLKYFSVKSYSRTKNRKTTTISSNENYPIFMRICKDGENEFKKIYQPLNPDKAFRFFYVGTKPKEYINGLAELKEAYQKLIAENESKHLDTDTGKTHTIVLGKDKLPEAVICSGERDALNVASFGYFPLWFNSESYNLSEKEYREISKYVERIYNIPDIDETGIKKSVELSLKYLDIFTVELPAWLSTYKDNRGKPRKDLRDYVELRPKNFDFKNLIKTACPCKFWEEVEDEKKGKRLNINTLYLLHFLKQNGFGKIIHPETKESIFVKVTGYIVEEIMPKQIRNFIVKFLKERHEKTSVLNLVLNSTRTNAGIMDDLDELHLDFTNYTIDGQHLFFANKSLYVTADKVEEKIGKNSGISVWNNNVNPHIFRRLEPSITVDDEGDVFINHTKSHYFRFLLNASRIFWREEFEHRAVADPAENETYKTKYKFAIDGDRLTSAEIAEQNTHLFNKIYAIGYLLHRYKSASKAMAVWIMENKLTNSDESSGGSGKSFMLGFLEHFLRIVTLNGRNKELTGDRFFMDRVDEFTDLLLLDDAQRYIQFDVFYSAITGNMPVGRKSLKTLEIKFKDSPKIAITSNFPPPSVDSSTMRRLLMVVFSDYYHKQTSENGYLETRQIADDFGYELHNEYYKQEWWNEDFNFLVDCLQFYLKMNAKDVIIHPPMENVNKRINIAIMGEAFQDWASVYFAPDGNNVDSYVNKTEALTDFKISTKSGWTTQKFTKALRAFCKNNNDIECLDPQELRDKNGRIIKRNGTVSVEMIYIQTKGTPLKEYIA